MEDLSVVSFSSKENFHKFMDIALSERWECIVRVDCEGIPMVEVSPNRQYGGPYAEWHSEVDEVEEVEEASEKTDSNGVLF